MWSIGFGLEKLGLVAVRRPVVFTLFMLLVSVFAAFQVPNVRFDGDVTAILPENSAAYRNYFNNRERFRDFGRDLTILVESDRLITASGLEDLRYLQLELSVTPGVANATTLFSVPLPDPATGEIGQFFPEEIAGDAEARSLVDRLLNAYPQAASLVSPQRNTAIILVSMTPETADKAGGYRAYLAVKEAAAAAAPSDFKLRYHRAHANRRDDSFRPCLGSDAADRDRVGARRGNCLCSVPQRGRGNHLRNCAGLYRVVDHWHVRPFRYVRSITSRQCCRRWR